MPIALVDSDFSAADSADQTDSPNMATSGSTLLVAIAMWYNGTTANVSIADFLNGVASGNTWNSRTAQEDADASGSKVRIFDCILPNTHASLHTVRLTGDDVFAALHVYAFSGTHSSSPFDKEIGDDEAIFGDESGKAGAILPAENNEIIIHGMVFGSAAVSGLAISGGYSTPITNAFVGGTTMGGGSAYLIQGALASTDPTWSWTGVTPATAFVAAAYKVAVAAPGRHNKGLKVTSDLRRPVIVGNF